MINKQKNYYVQKNHIHLSLYKWSPIMHKLIRFSIWELNAVLPSKRCRRVLYKHRSTDEDRISSVYKSQTSLTKSSWKIVEILQQIFHFVGQILGQSGFLFIISKHNEKYIVWADPTQREEHGRENRPLPLLTPWLSLIILSINYFQREEES